MWFYNKESAHIEVLTHLVSGVQVNRSGNEIWWRGNVLNVVDQPLEHDEMKIATCKDTDAASRGFRDICVMMKRHGKICGFRSA